MTEPIMDMDPSSLKDWISKFWEFNLKVKQIYNEYKTNQSFYFEAIESVRVNNANIFVYFFVDGIKEKYLFCLTMPLVNFCYPIVHILRGMHNGETKLKIDLHTTYSVLSFDTKAD